MKEKLLLVSFFLSLMLLATALCALQTSFWYQIFSSVAAPNLWLPVLIYVALYRTTFAAMVFCYVCLPAVLPMTAMTEATLLISCVAVVFATQAFKRRIYWSASTYVMLITAIGSVSFDIAHTLVDAFKFNSGWVSIDVIGWLIRALLSPLFAPGIFLCCRWIEKLTQQEQVIEFTAEVS